MSTITKERVAQFIKNPLDNGLTSGEQMELARIALASLEAEPIGFAFVDDVDLMRKKIKVGGMLTVRHQGEVALYTAPPAPEKAEPVAWLWSHRKHPSEVTLFRPEDDERAEGAHWSGWSCQALYTEPPAPQQTKE